MKALLYPLSELYGAITWARNKFYDRGFFKTHHASIPVVSIGNITAGGTGKTPHCVFLAQELKARGFSPVILSRGYGGSEPGPYRVKDSDSAELCGDEPLLMSRRGVCPVVISRKRSAGAKFIVHNALGDLIILDDGFQHRRLKRDLDIVLIDVTTKDSVQEVVSGRMLPFGRLREPRDEALARADIVILNERKAAQAMKEPPVELLRLIGGDKKIFLGVYVIDGVCSLAKGTPLAVGEVVAFCGIAGPHGFFETLVSLGYKIVAQEKFPDHYRFSFQDIEKLRLRYPHIPLVCTEKDAIRLTPEMSDGVYVVRARATVVPAAPFVDYVVGKLTPDHAQEALNQ